MTEPLNLWVPGRPKTKGSLDFKPGRRCRCCAACEAHLLGGGVVSENVVGSKRWRQLMAYAAKGAVRKGDGFPLQGRVAVSAAYYLPTSSAVAHGSGDLDKLARNTLDALTDAQVYSDDVQVTRLLLTKDVERERGHGVDLTVIALP